MDHYQLTRFELKDAGNNNVVVLVTGSLRYKAILQRAFSQFYLALHRFVGLSQTPPHSTRTCSRKLSKFR